MDSNYETKIKSLKLSCLKDCDQKMMQHRKHCHNNSFNLITWIYFSNEFNPQFNNYILNEKERLEAEGSNVNTDIFKSVLSLEDIQKVIDRVKNNKSVGIDNLLNEIVNNMSSPLLLSLFNKSFVLHP